MRAIGRGNGITFRSIVYKIGSGSGGWAAGEIESGWKILSPGGRINRMGWVGFLLGVGGSTIDYFTESFSW